MCAQMLLKFINFLNLQVGTGIGRIENLVDRFRFFFIYIQFIKGQTSNSYQVCRKTLNHSCHIT